MSHSVENTHLPNAVFLQCLICSQRCVISSKCPLPSLPNPSISRIKRPTILELILDIDQSHLFFRHRLTLLLIDHVLEFADSRTLGNVVERHRFTIKALDKECRDDEVPIIVILRDDLWYNFWYSYPRQGYKVDSGILDTILLAS